MSIEHTLMYLPWDLLSLNESSNQQYGNSIRMQDGESLDDEALISIFSESCCSALFVLVWHQTCQKNKISLMIKKNFFEGAEWSCNIQGWNDWNLETWKSTSTSGGMWHFISKCAMTSKYLLAGWPSSWNCIASGSTEFQLQFIQWWSK